MRRQYSAHPVQPYDYDSDHTPGPDLYDDDRRANIKTVPDAQEWVARLQKIWKSRSDS